MPVYGTYDASFDEELRPYIENLNKARGLIECRQARTLARKLMEENADFARLSESRVYENLSFRANVIAYLKAMVLSRLEMPDEAMKYFELSITYDPYMEYRANLDPEMFSLVKKRQTLINYNAYE
jgi:hypothetical protein